jgi:Coenzyme PQQ synthesis protein D (PqqD)
MLAVSANLRSVQSADGAVVLDINGGRMFSLNPVAARIVSLIGEGCEETAIVRNLRAESGCGDANVEADVHEFLQSLQKHGLLEGPVPQV